MSERYAIVITTDDGQEVVSNIMQYEGKPPAPRGSNAKTVKVSDGVKIGMVKGGTVDATGGFGFPAGSELAQGKGIQQKKAPAKKADDAKGGEA